MFLRSVFVFFNLKIILFLISFCCASWSLNSFSTPIIKWQGTTDLHLNSYMKVFNDFRTKTCVPKAEGLFDEYLKKYRGQGFWIPSLGDDIDVEAIKKLLPLMEEKIKWIKNQKIKVKNFGLPPQSVTNKLKNHLLKSLEFKKSELSKNQIYRMKMRRKSLNLQTKLKMSFESLVERISFLSNFNYPVDHLKNRKSYDTYKDQKATHLANVSFLKRKILEDGAYNPNHTDSDMFLRTTIDTLHYELQMHDFYLTENARYDLEYVIKEIQSEISRGKKSIIERLTEWEERATRFYHFYQKLTLPENQVEVFQDGEKISLNKKLVKYQNMATQELKDFVYKKQAEVYKYWSSRSEILKALFVIETILLNEVGSVDGKEALERKDVTRVIINRLDLPRYLTIGNKEHLYPYLKQVVGDFHLENEKWLNALFKQGEFSFTYFYMSSVKNIFCPDISFRAKKLREENIKIALDAIKEGVTDFSATRYFSRASMTGRISMDVVWEDYGPFPERPGLKIENQNNLLKQFNKRDYFYLYSFKDTHNDLYQVITMGENTYVMKNENGAPVFYSYRNPHFFRYFTKIKPSSVVEQKLN